MLGHGRWPHGAEWLCEAAIATYVPLVRALRGTRADGISGGVTLSISPVLAEQLSSPAFHELFGEYLDERIRTSGDEAARFETSGPAELAPLARRWERSFRDTRDFFFRELDRDLLGALAELEQAGALELATCGATHGYLPLLGRDESIALQIELACRAHERHFGRAPRGIWLPEAAYRPAGPWRRLDGSTVAWRPGIEDFLAASGLEYFIVDSSLLLGGRGAGSYPEFFGTVEATTPRTAGHGPHDTRRPYWVARESGDPRVAFYTRDPGTGLQVWSGEHGYPGDPAYLEFHKKSDGGGHRYWAVTGSHVDLADKQPYRPEAADERTGWQADHFRDVVAQSLDDGPDGAVLVAPYDAELFGHWWHEGVEWLTKVLRGFRDDPRVRLTTLDARLEQAPPRESVHLPEGSWGRGGRHEVWMNPGVEWSWRLIYPLEEQVWELAGRAAERDDPLLARIVACAARQLLLLSASDWQFLITTGSAADYATSRLRGHADDLARLTELGRDLLSGRSPGRDGEALLAELEARDTIFPELPRVVADVGERSAAPS